MTQRDAHADRIAERIAGYLERHWPAIPELERLALSAGLGVELVDELRKWPDLVELELVVDDELPAPRASVDVLAAARALSDLVDDARWLVPVAVAAHRRSVAHRLAVIAAQLDAARTRLIQEGESYAGAAWAYVDAGRVSIANYKLTLPTRASSTTGSGR